MDERKRKKKEKEKKKRGANRGKGVTVARVDSILSDFEVSSRDPDQAEGFSSPPPPPPFLFCVPRTCREYIRPSWRKIKRG